MQRAALCSESLDIGSCKTYRLHIPRDHVSVISCGDYVLRIRAPRQVVNACQQSEIRTPVTHWLLFLANTTGMVMSNESVPVLCMPSRTPFCVPSLTFHRITVLSAAMKHLQTCQQEGKVQKFDEHQLTWEKTVPRYASVRGAGEWVEKQKVVSKNKEQQISKFVC